MNWKEDDARYEQGEHVLQANRAGSALLMDALGEHGDPQDDDNLGGPPVDDRGVLRGVRESVRHSLGPAVKERSQCKKPRKPGGSQTGVRRHAEYDPITPFHSSPDDAGKSRARRRRDPGGPRVPGGRVSRVSS